MSAEERACSINAKVCDAARARRKPFVAWDQLPEEKRQRLIAVAERLNLEYGAAGDPPSRGMHALEILCEDVVISQPVDMSEETIRAWAGRLASNICDAASICDAPSRGLPADEPEVEVIHGTAVRA